MFATSIVFDEYYITNITLKREQCLLEQGWGGRGCVSFYRTEIEGDLKYLEMSEIAEGGESNTASCSPNTNNTAYHYLTLHNKQCCAHQFICITQSATFHNISDTIPLLWTR